MRQGNPFQRRRRPVPAPTGWRGRRVHRRSAPARCRRARQWSRAGSSRRCSASSCSLARTGSRRPAGWAAHLGLRRVGAHADLTGPTEQCLQGAVAARRGSGAARVASAPSGNRISGWVCRSSTLTSDSSQKPRAPSNWWEVRSTCRAVSAALNRSTSASAERTCAGSRFRSADGVLGELVQSAHRDGGIRDGEPDGLEVRQRLAELDPGRTCSVTMCSDCCIAPRIRHDPSTR